MSFDAKKLRKQESRMQELTNFFDVKEREERRRSAKALVGLYFDLVKVLAPPVFIEVGARDASVSFRARKVLPSARIVAFEASPHNVELYKRKFDFVENRIEYEQLAIADHSGELLFYVPRSIDGVEVPRANGLNSLLKRSDTNAVYDELKVKAVTLDDFFSSPIPKDCCVWIDVEGATGKVIAGGQQVLRQTQVLMIEVEDSPVWQAQWLVGDVYEFLSNLGLIPIARDFQWWPDNYNVVCVRHDLRGRGDVSFEIDRFYSKVCRRSSMNEKLRTFGQRLLRATRKPRDVVQRIVRMQRDH